MSWTKKVPTAITKRKTLYLAAAVLGIVLVMLSEALNKNESYSATDTMYEFTDIYGQQLEKKTEEILSKATGSNDVDVMITFKKSYTFPKETNDKADNFFLSASKEESQAKPMEIVNPEIAGVMVVCKGITSNEDFAVLKSAVSTVLSISKNKIYVVGG